MRASLALAISLALASAAAVAAAPESAETIVEFTINGQAQRETLVVRRDADGTLLLRAEDLPSLRLRTPDRGGVQIDGTTWFRLDASTGAVVKFDPATQHADVMLPAAAFKRTQAEVSRADSLPDLTVSTGGFLNYDLFGESSSSRNTFGGLAEAAVFGTWGVGMNTLLARDDDGERSVVRLDTSWTYDMPERLSTLRVGDAISVAGSWGRSVRFAGLQFGTNFATQPTLITTPLLSAQGSAVVPSTVDVFINGNRVSSQDVPPGPFTIDHVPAISGAGQMQVVVTDALGRQQVISQPYYSGPALLRAGLNEYSFEVGALRDAYGIESADYGDAMASATFRRGFTDQLTAEAHSEVHVGGGAAAGGNLAWRIGTFGIVTATAAVGGEDDMGWLAGAGIEHSGQRFNAFARTQLASRDFAQFGSVDEETKPRQRTFAGMGFDFGQFGNLQVAYGLQTYWDDPRQETIGVSHGVTLPAFGFLNLTLSQSLGEDDSTDVFLNWTMPFGDRRSASAMLRHSRPTIEGEDGLVAMASVQQSLPVGRGMGYAAMIASNDEGQMGVAAQGSAGTVGVQYARRAGEDGVRADASGGIAFSGAGVMPARRLDRSFAVVKVADYEGLTVYVENQPVGRTDEKGRVLLDGLRPYERNEISIDPVELPMDASLALPRVQITPAYRSGAVVDFPVTRTRAATLRLVQADGTAVPTGATVALGKSSIPVGFDGLVFLEDVPGRQKAVAIWGDERCAFEVRRPDGAELVPDLGTIACRHDSP